MVDKNVEELTTQRGVLMGYRKSNTVFSWGTVGSVLMGELH